MNYHYFGKIIALKKKLKLYPSLSRYPLLESDIRAIEHPDEFDEVLQAVYKKNNSDSLMRLLVLYNLYFSGEQYFLSEFPGALIDLLKHLNRYGLYPAVLNICNEFNVEKEPELLTDFTFKLEKEKAKALRGQCNYDDSFKVYSELFHYVNVANDSLKQVILLINIGKTAHNANARYGVYKEFAKMASNRAEKLLCRDQKNCDARRSTLRYLAISLDALAKSEFDLYRLTNNLESMPDSTYKSCIESWAQAERIFTNLGELNSLGRVRFRKLYSLYFHSKGNDAQLRFLQEFKESLNSLYYDQENRRGYAVRAGEFAEMLLVKGRTNEAQKYIQRSIEIAEFFSDWRTYSKSQILLAKAKFQLQKCDDSTTKLSIEDVKQCAILARKAMSSERSVYSDIDFNLSIDLANIYREIGDYNSSMNEIKYATRKLANLSERVLGDWRQLSSTTNKAAKLSLSLIVSYITPAERKNLVNSLIADYQILTNRQTNLLSQINRLSALDSLKSSLQHQLEFVTTYTLGQRHSFKNAVDDWNNAIENQLKDFRGSLASTSDQVKLDQLIEKVKNYGTEIKARAGGLFPQSLDKKMTFTSVKSALLRIQNARIFKLFDSELKIQLNCRVDIELKCFPQILELALFNIVENAAQALRLSNESPHFINIFIFWDYNTKNEEIAFIDITDNAGRHQELARSFLQSHYGGLYYSKKFFDTVGGKLSHGLTQDGETSIKISMPRGNLVRRDKNCIS